MRRWGHTYPHRRGARSHSALAATPRAGSARPNPSDGCCRPPYPVARTRASICSFLRAFDGARYARRPCVCYARVREGVLAYPRAAPLPAWGAGHGPGASARCSGTPPG
eukprot:1178933-Prorocentrum_minimum.AAC.4